jgi:hypothetical protein
MAVSRQNGRQHKQPAGEVERRHLTPVWRGASHHLTLKTPMPQSGNCRILNKDFRNRFAPGECGGNPGATVADRSIRGATRR